MLFLKLALLVLVFFAGTYAEYRFKLCAFGARVINRFFPKADIPTY